MENDLQTGEILSAVAGRLGCSEQWLRNWARGVCGCVPALPQTVWRRVHGRYYADAAGVFDHIEGQGRAGKLRDPRRGDVIAGAGAGAVGEPAGGGRDGQGGEQRPAACLFGLRIMADGSGLAVDLGGELRAMVEGGLLAGVDLEAARLILTGQTVFDGGGNDLVEAARRVFEALRKRSGVAQVYMDGAGRGNLSGVVDAQGLGAGKTSPSSSYEEIQRRFLELQKQIQVIQSDRETPVEVKKIGLAAIAQEINLLRGWADYSRMMGPEKVGALLDYQGGCFCAALQALPETLAHGLLGLLRSQFGVDLTSVNVAARDIVRMAIDAECVKLADGERARVRALADGEAHA